MKRGLILTGGRRPSEDLLEKEIRWADGIICADSGYDVLSHVSNKLKLVIGDFDSSKRVKEMKEKGLPVEVLSPMKDETDTEMAMTRMLSYNPEEIHILGATGSRWDHSIATILSLEAYVDVSASITLIDENNRLRMVGPGTYVLKKEGFTYMSFIPVSDVIDISTHGLKYEVSHLKLYRKKTRGVSNELLAEEGRVDVHTGVMLMIHSKDA
ncbi:MAG: thiamine diphosphokinase [Peptoniphilus sp.]|nr:thiamine diphosphokinase [Peptoniphilus sp.]MDY3119286.1 thiamine diphosphokinase [Peptoniphilus sp.]